MRGNWLFHHDMQSRLQSRDALSGMLRMWRGDYHGVDFAGTSQLLGITEDLYTSRFVTLEFLRRSAANGFQFAAWNFPGQQVFGVVLADVAHSNDAEADALHDLSSST